MLFLAELWGPVHPGGAHGLGGWVHGGLQHQRPRFFHQRQEPPAADSGGSCGTLQRVSGRFFLHPPSCFSPLLLSFKRDGEQHAEAERLWQIFFSGFASFPYGARRHNNFWVNICNVRNVFKLQQRAFKAEEKTVRPEQKVS